MFGRGNVSGLNSNTGNDLRHRQHLYAGPDNKKFLQGSKFFPVAPDQAGQGREEQGRQDEFNIEKTHEQFSASVKYQVYGEYQKAKVRDNAS